jgi:hypothetical protein|tara:strand:+ start:2685 stop:2990 length:306 start_codon:yes stop_codon:yes gene_type:complete
MSDPRYRTARWRKLRRSHLNANPICAFCEARGKVVLAKVCDHVNPHRGDDHVFWNGPFQSLCQSCHSGDKQRIEHGGKPRPFIGSDGWPIDDPVSNFGDVK